jgi:hypothetical protein
MPTEVFLPDCLLECYHFLYPRIDFSTIHFYDGIPIPYSAGSQSAITLTWGFGSGIHIYMREGVWAPCDQSGNGLETFLTLAHELVHVLQIMNLPDPELWIPNYLGHYVRSGFSFDCSNDLEQEAYEHANGCSSPTSSVGALRECVRGWAKGRSPCDCSASPVWKFTLFPEGDGELTFLDMLKEHCSNLVMESSTAFSTYSTSLGAWVGLILVDILLLPTSSEVGFVGAVIGAVIGAVLGAIVLFGLLGVLGAIVGALIGLVLGWLVVGLLGLLADWIGGLFGGPSKKLLKVYVGSDGSGVLNLGGFKTNSVPFAAADGFVYFQGTDNTLWRVNSVDGSGTKVGGFQTTSSPFVPGDGFIYFQGTDDKLWKVPTIGAGGVNLGGFKTKSTPFATSDGFVYFQGTDDTLWKVNATDGSGTKVGGFQTKSTPFTGADGFVYFQGTDNTLWKVNATDGSGTKVGGFQTKSSPFVPGDGFIYFQGTDDKLWKVPTVGSGGVNLGGFKTKSAPFAAADGFVYFQGTDNTLWKVDAMNGTGKMIAGLKTNSAPFVPGDGFAYCQAT